MVVVEPLADGNREAVALADDGAGRADLGGAVGDGEVRVGQAPAGGIDDQARPDAAAADATNITIVDTVLSVNSK